VCVEREVVTYLNNIIIPDIILLARAHP